MVFSCYAILRNVGDKGKETSGSEMLKERDVEVAFDRVGVEEKKGVAELCMAVLPYQVHGSDV